jgi:16S rRNA G1207 methylase RsmC
MFRAPQPWRQVSYDGLSVYYHSGLDGGGGTFGQEYRDLSQWAGQPPRRRVFEWCAGPGFIGFSLLAYGLCDSLGLADVNEAAVDACRITAAENGLEDRVWVYHSDNLASVPGTERWDLVVGNPPHFADAFEGDPPSPRWGWQLHGEF